MNSPRRQHPLAIIGMGCLFPKADGLEAYWANIKNGIDAITQIPETHWRTEDYFSEDQKKADHTYGRRGGFLPTLNFDPLKYGIPPNILEATDTSQLLGMVVAEAALRDAGYGNGRAFDRDRVAVILGVTGALELVIPLGARLGHPLWRKAMAEAGVPDELAQDALARMADSYVDWQENSFPGLLGNVVAGRISKYLDLGGTNCVVDAACASSLSAMHLAALELESGKADMVVTGGIDTFNDIFMYMCFSKTPALSPTGDARPFDHRSDGTILGEGLGVIVLKRLEDAERDGDRVYAVLKGIGSPSDGKGDAIYAPNAQGQMKALREAYAKSGVSPRTIELVEAHGTGTKRGDAVEVNALKEVYGEAGETGAWCALGSVKSQIGHTKAAAGSAGLIKAVMALHEKVLPPTVKVEQAQDAVKPGTTPFYVNTVKRPWLPRADHPRRAAVSSFGFGGSNFHCVLEEYGAKKVLPSWDGDIQIVALSGENAIGVKNALAAVPVDGDWPTIRSFAAKSRKDFRIEAEHRLLMVVERARTELKTLIEHAGTMLEAASGRIAQTGSRSPKADGVFYGHGAATGALAVVFPGQGAQYTGMLRDLACAFPEMLDTLAEAESVTPVFDRIYPHPRFDDAARKSDEAALTATGVAQPAIGAASLGAYRVLQRFGIDTAAFAGHSYGELTALCAAGRFDARSFFGTSQLRGRLMAGDGGDTGSMLAVRAPLAEIERVLVSENLDVIVANKNAPDQSVLSGTTAEIDRASAAFKKHRMTCTKLPVGAAFHSSIVADASGPFLDGLRHIQFHSMETPVYSNTLASRYPQEADESRELLARQLAAPVEFVAMIQAMYDAGIRTFVEAGPGGRLTGLINAILAGKDFAAVAIDPSNGKQSGIVDLAKCLARVAAAGHPVTLIEWDNAFSAEPIEAGKPRMTVPLSGANYRAPRKVRPPRERSHRPVLPDAGAAAERFMTPSTPPAPLRAALPAIPGTPQTQRHSESRPEAHHVAELVRQSQESIATLQKMHEHTAALHKQYLDGQTQAAKAIQTLLHQHQRIAQTAPVYSAVPEVPIAPARGVPSPIPTPRTEVNETPAPVSLPPTSTLAAAVAPVLLAIVSEKTGYPAEMLDLSMTLDADLGIDSIKRVEILSALQERIPALPTIQPEELGRIRTLRDVLDAVGEVGAAQESSAISSAGVESLLLRIVAEKTGYPVEMLDLAMALESDLGIDSIKRVEIVSALQEQAPDLPSVEAEDLGRLRTLYDVVSYLASRTALVPAPWEESPAAIFDGAPVENVLLEIVAGKTGYPVDMLELSMQLDSDLGIDSIKRVEILSALHEQMPALLSIEAEDLGKLRTLADIIHHLKASSPARREVSPIPAQQSQPVSVRKKSDGRLERSVVRPVPISGDAYSEDLRLNGHGAIWVTDDGSDFSRALVKRLQALELKARLIALNHAFSDEPLQGLVIVAPEGGCDDTFLKQSLFLAQRLAPALHKAVEHGPALLASISRLDGAFGLASPPVNDTYEASSGGLAGLVKTASHEWPAVACKAIDLGGDFTSVSEAASRVVDELRLHGPLEVGLARAHRWTLNLVAEPRGNDAPADPLGTDDVIVITGGARGVTAAAAVALAERYRPTLVLLGRSSSPHAEEPWLHTLDTEAAIKKALLDRAAGKRSPREIDAHVKSALANREALETLRRIEAAGARAVYRSVDIRDRDGVQRAFDEIQASVGPITGLVHGAGVLADRRIADKSPEQVDAVYDTKVVGLRNLLEAFGENPLKVLALFSSSTARFGRTGQADYAMANEVLNKIAQAEARQRPECRVISFNWGPWAGGMVTPALERVFASEGVSLIGLDAGARFFIDEIESASAGVEVLVLGGGSRVSAAPTSPVATTLTRIVERAVSVETFPILRSHVLDGKAVLPLALYVECFAHAALHGNPGLRFHGLNDLRVLKGVVLDEKEARTLDVLAGKAEKRGDSFVVPVELRCGSTLHGRAEVVLVPKLPAAPAAEALPTLGNYRHAGADFYGEGLLFHGPELRGLVEIEGYATDAISAIARTAPRPSEWMLEPLRKTWLADPLILDCVFQMMILWSLEHHGAPSLPVFAGRYRQFHTSFPKGRFRIAARITQDNAHGAHADIDFFNASNGDLIACITDYECVIDQSLTAAFEGKQLGGERALHS